jgi:ABC-type multidrug transport system ATPase subunit
VFKDINLTLNAGDLVGLIGDNGVGKSTFLKTMTGNLAPLAGEIKINSKSSYTILCSTISTIIIDCCYRKNWWL